jgi:hypothetical protein
MELTKEQKNRIEACREAVDGVLDNYKCALVPQLTIMQGQIISHNIAILPQKEDKRIIVPRINEDKVRKGINNGA